MEDVLQQVNGIGITFESRDLDINQNAAILQRVRSFYEVARNVVSKINQGPAVRKRILVVDDEPLMFDLIEEYLREAHIPCEIMKAHNGLKAYDLAMEYMPDLIIADWLMPVMSGIELIRALKQNPATRYIPVILVTGVLASHEQLDEVISAGAIDYVKKPLDYGEFKARVKTALVLDESLKETRHIRESVSLKDQLLRYLVDSMPHALFYMDKSGKVLGCNSGFEVLFNLQKSDIRSLSYEALLPREAAEAFGVHLHNMVELGIPASFELPMPPLDGSQRHLMASLTTFCSSTELIVIAIITDITHALRIAHRKELGKLHADLETKHRELAMQTELLMHARGMKQTLLEDIRQLQPFLGPEGKSRLLGVIRQLRREINEESLLEVERKFDELHGGLYAILEKACPDITRNEKRLCAYLKMNHSAADIARITDKSLNSINVGFARLRTKLNLPSNKDLKSFLNEYHFTGGQECAGKTKV